MSLLEAVRHHQPHIKDQHVKSNYPFVFNMRIQLSKIIVILTIALDSDTDKSVLIFLF